jgi:hypothetical protein
LEEFGFADGAGGMVRDRTSVVNHRNKVTNSGRGGVV